MPLKKYQKYLVAVVPLFFIAIIGYYFSDILTYVVLAWILSMIGAPIHNRLRGIIGNTGSALVTLLTFSIITLAIIWAFIPPIIQQARNFSNIDYDKVVSSMEEPLNDWNEWLIEKKILKEQEESPLKIIDSLVNSNPPIVEILNIDTLVSHDDTIRNHITLVIQINHPKSANDNLPDNESLLADSFVERARKNLMGFLNPSRISQMLSSIFGALGNTLIGVLSVFFITFFFLKEQGLFSKIIQSVSPDSQEEKWVHAFDDSAELLKRYFIGVVIQIIIITIFVSSALGLLDFQNALLIAFFAALMNVIPYLGPILGALFAVIITLSSNLDASFYDVLLPKLGLIALVFGCMQLFDNFLLQPNIFSKSVKAHPLEIFIVILIGAKLGGILGMVIAIPLYTILRVMAKVFLSEFKIVQSITRNL